MQSFTTQSHQRNYQGNVVAESSPRARQKHHKVLAGLATCAVALSVAITGGCLGSTAQHNQKLKSELNHLRTQTAQVLAATQNADYLENAEYAELDEKYFYPVMTLEARPTETEDKAKDTLQADEIKADEGQTPAVKADEERAPQKHGKGQRAHGPRRALRRVPISDQKHDVAPLPAVEHHHNHHENKN